ncbi:carbohydrate esterase family 4 [Aquipluma nitroreducens]|uniref:Carbohydrate esterase family 4 n=1 Tax=Aquipluma nitroreducens TaxID=2010828 RepID=A0A5K7SDS0_9BACT|nr:polysaccharide deacetylase family protein [Aquipluma nitroreducens]BBE19587.1 carbohydrate esterase family 4 [Aquipluma nitroreducens]
MKITVTLLLILFTAITGFSRIVKKPIPDKLVVLTFDDATASQYSVVAPLLKEFGFGATFFICEFPPNFNDTAKYMNWRQIGELNRMGFEIANHTRNHPAIAKLSKEKIEEQLNYIERKCDSMKIRGPVTFAYPGYSLSLPGLKVLKGKDYQFARAGGSRAYDPMTDHPLLIPSWAMNSENKSQIMEAFDEAHNGKIVILTIHGVPDAEHPWVNTTPELFKEYLQYLSDNHFNVIAFRDLGKYINAKKAMETIVPDLTKKLKN